MTRCLRIRSTSSDEAFAEEAEAAGNAAECLHEQLDERSPLRFKSSAVA
ncbi:hypothetical protein AKJ09_08538 [Labilithrix luteola]|uniref:Uncharacterized protein n=1 Tax=Labilithrix luteola TaxID=1391654 RepID=A0A0K1Q8Y6_9BACT|nr:hypothetical protein AKJ09_08538 [Labilithrix luteola]